MGGFPLARGRSNEGVVWQVVAKGLWGRIKAGKIGKIVEKLGDHNMTPLLGWSVPHDLGIGPIPRNWGVSDVHTVT